MINNNKEYRKQYRLKNKDKFREYNKRYRTKNKDKIREKNRQYRLKNRLKINAYRRLYYKKNKQKFVKYIRNLRYKTKESYDNFLKYQKQYYEKAKKLRKNEIIYKKYNVKRVIFVENKIFKGLIINLQSYKFYKKSYKKYLDKIFTKEQIKLLLQGLIDYLLVV